MLTHYVDEVKFEGFTHYRPGKEIPNRPEAETYLVVVCQESEVDELWIVQSSPDCYGFVELGKYYRRLYGWPVTKAQIFRLDLSHGVQMTQLLG